MILTDTGPLLAMLDRSDTHHQRCLVALQQLPPGPMVTSCPCFTEAMYLLGEVGGDKYQTALWDLRRSGLLELFDLDSAEADRMADLMAKYANVPMDLADASLVVKAESLNLRKVFSFDSDFHIYRLSYGSALQVIG